MRIAARHGGRSGNAWKGVTPHRHCEEPRRGDEAIQLRDTNFWIASLRSQRGALVPLLTRQRPERQRADDSDGGERAMKASTPVAAPTRNPTAIASTVTSRPPACAKSRTAVSPC